MSSDPPPGDRSHAADATARASPLGEASLVRVRGDTLLQALEARAPGSRRHADATAAYAFATAAELDLDRASCELIREAARLHDIGQLYLPTELVAQPMAPPSAPELARLESHGEAGQRLGLGAGLGEQVCDWIRHGRERVDGLGLPDRLAGERIPAASRIIRAACAYDVALADAPPPPDRHRSEALARLRESTDAELDARVVDALAVVVERAAAAAR